MANPNLGKPAFTYEANLTSQDGSTVLASQTTSGTAAVFTVPAGTYATRARTKDDHGYYSTWTNLGLVTYTVPVPAIAGKSNDYTGLSLSWSTVTGSVGPYSYEVQVDTGSIVALSGTAYSVASPAGTHSVSVRAVDGRGTNRSAWSSTSVVVGDVEAPSSLSPSTSNSYLRLSWVQGPATNTPYTYLVRIGTSPGASDVATADNISGTYYEKALNSGSYYVSITAKDNRGTPSPQPASAGPTTVSYAPALQRPCLREC